MVHKHPSAAQPNLLFIDLLLRHSASCSAVDRCACL